jgi:hypothetical protein
MRPLRFKSLGGAILAALVMSAAIASSAQAALFTTELSPATVEASQSTTHRFAVNGFETTICSSEVVLQQRAGALEFPRSSLTLTPTYPRCVAPGGFVLSTVDTTGCDFVLSAPGAVVAGRVPGTLQVVCAPGRKITVTAVDCEWTIGPQTISSGFTLQNRVSFPRTIELEFAVTSLAVTVTKAGRRCSFLRTGAATGSYTGSSEAKAFLFGTPVGLELR